MRTLQLFSLFILFLPCVKLMAVDPPPLPPEAQRILDDLDKGIDKLKDKAANDLQKLEDKETKASHLEQALLLKKKIDELRSARQMREVLENISPDNASVWLAGQWQVVDPENPSAWSGILEIDADMSYRCSVSHVGSGKIHFVKDRFTLEAGCDFAIPASGDAMPEEILGVYSDGHKRRMTRMKSEK
jgi:hypothetical protein